MNFVDAFKILQDSDIFRKWDRKNSFLSYAFILISKDVKEEWQIGYYNPDSEKIVTFTIGEEIGMNPETEVLKQDSIKELDVNTIKVNHDKAIEIADMLQKQKYPQHLPLKKIVILQNLDVGQVWNITYLTVTYKTLNFKIDTFSGNILKDDLADLFKFDK